jgi:hypothetical protein
MNDEGLADAKAANPFLDFTQELVRWLGARQTLETASRMHLAASLTSAAIASARNRSARPWPLSRPLALAPLAVMPLG